MKWTRVIVWKNFSNDFRCELMAGDEDDIGTYFKTILNISGKNSENKDIVYLYTGYPCGDKCQEYSGEHLCQQYPDKYHSIEQMFQFAINIGFTREQVDAFINKQEKCWIYDENGKITNIARSWHWEFD